MRVEEALDNVRLGRDENSSGLVAGVGRPLLGLGDLDDVFPVRDGREDLEGLRKGSRLVPGQNLTNSANWSAHTLEVMQRQRLNTHLLYTSTTLGGSS